MSLYDPSESKARKVLRWTFWIIVWVAAVLYGLATNPEGGGGLWDVLKFVVLWVSGVILVYVYVVEPIQSQIRSLEYRIDELRRRVDVESISDKFRVLEFHLRRADRS